MDQGRKSGEIPCDNPPTACRSSVCIGVAHFFSLLFEVVKSLETFYPDGYPTISEYVGKIMF